MRLQGDRAPSLPFGREQWAANKQIVSRGLESRSSCVLCPPGTMRGKTLVRGTSLFRVIRQKESHDSRLQDSSLGPSRMLMKISQTVLHMLNNMGSVIVYSWRSCRGQAGDVPGLPMCEVQQDSKVDWLHLTWWSPQVRPVCPCKHSAARIGSVQFIWHLQGLRESGRGVALSKQPLCQTQC
jgi:hypothetical protein